MSSLDEFDNACSKITQERGKVYAPPPVNFDRIVRLQDIVADCPNSLVTHALNMICVKIARLIERPDHLDSWVDIVGYARTGVMCLDDNAQKGTATLKDVGSDKGS